MPFKETSAEEMKQDRRPSHYRALAALTTLTPGKYSPFEV